MKYIDEFRNPVLIKEWINKIHKLCGNSKEEITLMEVCGTHTMSIFRSGIRKLLPKNIKLLSGPGCPVCVTENKYIDKAIAYSRKNNVIITTFGDMLKVPGSSSSLQKENAKSKNIMVVYSCLDALKIANNNPNKSVIFLGIGFETTIPTIAAVIKKAENNNVSNFFVLSGHKLIPPALKALVQSDNLKINGLILPGHVSTIIGSRPYEFLSSEYGIPCAITGFEPLDIAQGIYLLLNQIINKTTPKVEIQYNRSVKENGNPTAKILINEVFETTDSLWRGIGNIPNSGLAINSRYSRFNPDNFIEIEVEQSKENKNCICGQILTGTKIPPECKLFRKTCTPENPCGACMVSSEGTCAAYYKYDGNF